ncbi:MAG: Crp/Fnr family transcriptional regulator [Chryseolinea sp.]
MLRNFLSENFRLKTDQIFGELTSDEHELLLKSSVTHLYKKGDVLFREEGIPAGIYLVRSGRVKKYKTTGSGTEKIFYLCCEDELLGYHALLSGEFYSDSAAAVEDSEITFIPKEAFLKVLNDSASLANALLKAMGHEFCLFINSITNLATKSVRERVALNLLILDEKFKPRESNGSPSAITLSRADLANMVGTAKENLVRILQEFKKAGLIEKSDKCIRILDHKNMIIEADILEFSSRR